MDREKKLAKNTLIISIGTICTKLVTFFLLPLYTGILTTEEYGIVDLLNTLVFLLIPIITFQVELALLRYLIENRENESQKKNIISSAFFSLILQCCIFLLIFLISSPLIENEYKYFLVINIISSIFSSLMLQISRGLGDNKKYAIGSFISAASTITLNVFFLVFLKMRVNGMLLGTMIGQIICALYLFIFLKIYKYISVKSFDWKVVKYLWKYSIPLIPNAIAWWIFQSSDRVIVSTLLGLSMTGILSAASKFSGVFTTMYNIFDRSWFESINLHHKDKDIESFFNNTFNVIVLFFSSTCMCLIACMPFIYHIMINENYNYGYGLVPILLISCIFNVIQGMVAVIYAANKDTKSIAKTSLAAALLNIIIHFSLIKFIGLYAAAVSTLGAFMIIAIYRIYDIRKKYMKIYLDKKIIIQLLIAIATIIPLYYINNFYLNIVSIAISLFIAFLFNKNSIDTILGFIKRKKKSI